MIRLLAASLVRLAAALLPVAHRDWGRAMVAEAGAARPAHALSFALGCLRAAASLRFCPLSAEQEFMMPFIAIDRPRRLGMACAAAAVGLGFAYLAAAGAPATYFAINGAALLLGLLALGVLREAGRLGRIAPGSVSLALSGLLLLVSVRGVSADGVTRWVAVGGVMLQPSLILVPLIALSVVHAPGRSSALAVMVAAAALALQPDRAMAAALAAGLAALALVRRDRAVLVPLAAASLGFAVTMFRPDASPAVPFVDQIFYSSFAVHALAGSAVVGGAALMLVPAIAGLLRDPDHRPAYAMFGVLWLAVIAAAALGNYPTPLVGYGGSAILGYLISLIALPRAGRAMAATRGPETATERAGESSLRTCLT